MSDQTTAVQPMPFAGQPTEGGITEEDRPKITVDDKLLFLEKGLLVEHATRIDHRLRGTPQDLGIRQIGAIVLMEIMADYSGTISPWDRFYEIMLGRMLMRPDAHEIASVFVETVGEVLDTHTLNREQKNELFMQLFGYLSAAVESLNPN